MTAIEFKNPPVVEIVAELKWVIPNLGMQFAIDHQVEEWFMRFGGEVYQKGYKRAERLVPPGFPIQPYQVGIRFRQSEDIQDQSKNVTLFQLGSGVFTANALPPYETWETFSPVIASGLEALNNSKTEPERTLPYSQIGLRYINAFRPSMLNDLDPADFMRDVLGFKIEMPQALNDVVAANSKNKPMFQNEFTLKNGMTMNITSGQATIDGGPACAFDLAITNYAEIDPSKAMEILNEQHNVIREVFLSMTKNIHERMGPKN